MTGEPFTTETVREAVAVLEANDVRRGIVVPEGHEIVFALGPSGPTAYAVASDREAFAELGRRLVRLLRGPKAPTRKRPRRVARKIEARDGRLRYTPRWAR